MYQILENLETDKR